MAWLCANAAAEERGHPLLSIYPPEVHKAGPQTFAAAQDAKGILYFGNLAGLVIHDGAWWRLVKLPDDQAVFSVAADAKGRVAIGATDDFGYLEASDTGVPRYRSLTSRLPAAQREIGNIRGICVASNGFFAAGETRLLFADEKGIRSVAEYEQDLGIRDCAMHRGSVLLYGRGGIRRHDPKTGTLTVVDTREVDHAMTLADGRLLTVVRDIGIFVDSSPFAPEASAWLKGKMTSGGCLLHDGRIVLTSRHDGVLILRRDGAIDARIGQDAGLPDSLLSGAIADRDGSLWIPMEGPIVRIDLASPVSVYDDRGGFKGSATDVTTHRGRSIGSSTHGLYFLGEDGAARSAAQLRDGIWRILSVDDDLLIGTTRGVYLRREEKEPEPLATTTTAIYDLRRSSHDPSRIWAAGRTGVFSLHRAGKQWRVERRIPMEFEYVSSVLEHDGSLWCGSVFDGVIRIDEPLAAKPRVTQYGTSEMIPFVVGGKIAIVRSSDGQIYEVAGNGLIEHRTLRVSAPGGFFVMEEDSNGNLWVNSTPPRVFRKRAGGGFEGEGVPVVSINATDIQSMRGGRNGVMWFASDRGLFHYNPLFEETVRAQPVPQIRRVLAGSNDVLLAGMSAATTAIGHGFGRIRIEFAPASYRPGVTYQYLLDPIDKAWSEWTDQASIDYTNLNPGPYVFRLRARGAGTTVSQEASWKFQVLPPWYETRWAMLLWTILALAAVALLIRIRTASLHRQAALLRAKVDEQTAQLQQTVALLEEANARLETLSLADDLTGIANRRLFQRALQDEWNRGRRQNTAVALVLLDLDYFKELNDQRGHPAGDEALRRIGQFLSQTIRRSGEVVARYGGEEFAILLPGLDVEDALQVAESLRAGIASLDICYEPAAPRRCMTASCGVASVIPTEDLRAEDLVERADRALYAAKHSGRNCVRIAEEEDGATWMSGGVA